jgi:hypothetical protein
VSPLKIKIPVKNLVMQRCEEGLNSGVKMLISPRGEEKKKCGVVGEFSV